MLSRKIQYFFATSKNTCNIFLNIYYEIGFEYRVDDRVDQFSKESKSYGDKFRYKKRAEDDGNSFFK